MLPAVAPMALAHLAVARRRGDGIAAYARVRRQLPGGLGGGRPGAVAGVCGAGARKRGRRAVALAAGARRRDPDRRRRVSVHELEKRVPREVPEPVRLHRGARLRRRHSQRSSRRRCPRRVLRRLLLCAFLGAARRRPDEPPVDGRALRHCAGRAQLEARPHAARVVGAVADRPRSRGDREAGHPLHDVGDGTTDINTPAAPAARSCNPRRSAPSC